MSARRSFGEYFVGNCSHESALVMDHETISTAPRKCMYPKSCPCTKHDALHRLWDNVYCDSDDRRVDARAPSQKTTTPPAEFARCLSFIVYGLATLISSRDTMSTCGCMYAFDCVWSATARRQSAYYRHPVPKQGYHMDS